MECLESPSIISQVQQYPCLYDLNHDHYKDKEVRKAAWLEITQALVGEEKWDSLDEHTKEDVGREVQKRWKSMKDTLLKSQKLQESSQKGRPRRPYIYRKQLDFLLPFLKIKQRNKRKGSRDIKIEDLEELSENEEMAELDQESSVKRSSRLKRQSETLNEEVLSVPIINVEGQSSLSQFLLQDPDQMFLLSQLPLIKRIKPSDKVDFQIKFMQLIQSYTSSNK